MYKNNVFVFGMLKLLIIKTPNGGFQTSDLCYAETLQPNKGGKVSRTRSTSESTRNIASKFINIFIKKKLILDVFENF